MISNSKIITIHDFHAVKLDNKRDIYVYLPHSYDTDLNKKYPVLYMHDGQFAFQSSENTGGSWNVHKTVDRLIEEGKMKEIIVVAVPNMSAARVSEYVHYEITYCELFNLKPNGVMYEDFLINDLKPYIDENFRTLRDSKNTALMGSSMGGFVTYNLGHRRPDVFGNLAVMSPFLTYVNTDTLEECKEYKLYKGTKVNKLWIDIGEIEGFLLDKHVRMLVDELTKVGYEPGKNLFYYYVPNGTHFEKDWEERIHMPLLYFFGDIGKVESVELYGRNTVGLKGMKVNIYPTVKYDSGFSMTDTDAKYIVDNPDILEVEPNGAIIPKGEGTAKLTYVSNEFEVSKEYSVIEELPETVKVKINITVPENTPDDARITMSHLETKKTEKGLYQGVFVLPRDCAFTFRVAIGVGFQNQIIEQDKNKKDLKYRTFKATDDMELNYVVENWKGM